MNVIATELEGVVIVEPRVFEDERGYFFESWNKTRMIAAGIAAEFVQDNESMSGRGVLRGLHYQLPPFAQAKLIRVVRGRVLDVAVDVRRGSPMFGQYEAVELSGENKRQLYIPKGFAHGFLALDDETVFAYKCDRPYMASHERGIDPRDPAIGIDWGLGAEEYIVSAKDAGNPLLKDAEVFSYSERGAY